jgi:hypothetical protein
MRDLIVGCATNYDWSKLKYWVNSINASGFEGDKILILMNCDKETVGKISDSGFGIIAFNKDENDNLTYNSNMMVHVERFFHIYQLLKDNLYRYVITTDVKDVVFQQNPSEWLEKNLPNTEDLVFSSESMKYKDEPWGDQNLRETFGTQIYEDFKNNTIFNVGVLAGRGYAMKDLMMNIFASCLGRPIKICDQSTFNFLISQHPYLKTSLYTKSEDGWACQLGTTADPSKIEQFRPFLLEPSPKLDGDMVVTSTGIEYTIVHQYDRVPEWKKVIEKKYDDK